MGVVKFQSESVMAARFSTDDDDFGVSDSKSSED